MILEWLIRPVYSRHDGMARVRLTRFPGLCAAVYHVCHHCERHQMKPFSEDSVSPDQQEPSNGNRDFSRIEKLLLEQREQILKEAGRVVGSGVASSPGLTPDPADMATREEHEAFSMRLKEREKNLLRKIDLAIDRIKEGDFGICEDCGEPIEEKRLMARPVTTLCIDCKTLQETRENAKRPN